MKLENFKMSKGLTTRQISEHCMIKPQQILLFFFLFFLFFLTGDCFQVKVQVFKNYTAIVFIHFGTVLDENMPVYTIYIIHNHEIRI